jgi:4-diphosphocytidyl-2-C-methyl-D-erythritol kinase
MQPVVVKILEPVDLDLSGYYIVLVFPGIEIKTATSFEGIIPQPSPFPIREKIKTPIASWKEWMVNDFEKTVFRQFPEIESIRNDLYASGALYASMTGSGSTCYGIFKSLPELDFRENYQVFKVRLK